VKKRAACVLNVFLMLVFVNFVLANTAFIHTHSCFDGHVVTHSHPYFPSAHHGHSQQALDSIASFNSAAESVDMAPAVSFIAGSALFTIIADKRVCHVTEIAVFTLGLRGPPQCV